VQVCPSITDNSNTEKEWTNLRNTSAIYSYPETRELWHEFYTHFEIGPIHFQRRRGLQLTKTCVMTQMMSRTDLNLISKLENISHENV
jgi:hypothetical protein